MRYVAIVNVPGYLPTDDEPPTFDTISEAWWHLYHERCAEERDAINETGLCDNCGEPYDDGHDDDSETGKDLAKMAKAVEPEAGTVWGPTPCFVGISDLGWSYTVQPLED